jgi:GntR family transcriptional regulator
VPLYEQLGTMLTRLIETGRLRPGTILPREPEFAEKIGVSRQTLNQALGGLARRGLVNRYRGVGTFVASPFVEQPLDQLYSFIQTLSAKGRTPRTRLLGRRLIVDDYFSTELTGRPGHLVAEISRLRLVDDDPFVIETIFLEETCGQKLPEERLEREALYDLLRELCDIRVTHADEIMSPIKLDRAEARLLGVNTGEPGFMVERTTYAGDRVVEERRSVIRGDRYRFRVHLEASRLEAGDAE